MADLDVVEISGTGAITALGNGAQALHEGLAAGKSGVAPTEEFAALGHPSKLGATVRAFDPTTIEATGAFRRLPPTTQIAVASADEALRSAGIDPKALASERVGVFLGTDQSILRFTQRYYDDLLDKGPRAPSPLLFQEMVFNAAAGTLCLRYGFKGASIALTSGYAAGLQVIDMAARYLREGRIDLALVVAIDECAPVNFVGLSQLRVLSRGRKGAPEGSRPFDARRDGFVAGSAAGAMIMERGADLLARGAPSLGRYLASGTGFDTYKPQEASPIGSSAGTGKGFADAAGRALAAAGLSARDIGHVQAAANSTPGIDLAEARGLARVFEGGVPVTAIKGAIGECFAATPMIGALAALEALRTDQIAPTLGLETLDPEIRLDVVTSTRAGAGAHALVNAFSFNGTTVASVFGKAG